MYHQIQIFHTMHLWLKLIILLKFECHKDSWHSAWAWRKLYLDSFFSWLHKYFLHLLSNKNHFTLTHKKCYLQHANTKVKTEMCFKDIISGVPGEILFLLAVIIALKICDNRSCIFNSIFLNSHLYQIKSICYFLNSTQLYFYQK